MKEIKKSASFTSKQKGKDVKFNIDLNYSPEYDSFIIKVKEGEGFMAYSSNIERMPLKVIQKLNEMLEEVLIQAGSETEMKEDLEVELGAEPNPSHSSRSHEGSVKIKTHRVKVKSLSEAQNEVRGFIEENDLGAGNFTGGDLFSHGKKIGRVSYNGRLWNLKDEPMKMSNGGDFQAGVYAKGGSLQAHGIEIGDTFVRTISGGIQKIKDKNGKIVYVDLSTGERDSQPPLPFNDGGGLQDEVYIKYLNKDKKFKEDIKYFKSYDEARKWGRENLENFNSDMINFKFENGGGIGIKEDIDLTDDNVMRVRKPAMPNRKLSNQEIAEKYNASAYEYMETDKKAFGGGLFSRAKMMTKAKKYPDLEDKNVTLKNGKLVKVFSQNDNKLKVIEFGKIGSGVAPTTIDISEVETIYNNGGALVGNQKRIDMNKNGKIDAEDFKLLRSSMNGAWRNERKHVNHDEDYEVRYARKKPSRTGYKGKRKFEGGGGISNFERFSNVVAKNYEGKSVKPKYQKEYGKTYSKSEAKQVGNRVAGKVKMMKKAESGAEVKKGNRGGVMVLAKKIRKDGESWKDALKRAGQQLK